MASASSSESEAWAAWHDAAADPAVDAALRGLYAELDAAVAARGPTCWTSGKCCDFGSYGHRLYVTALEIAWFLGQADVNATTQAGGTSTVGTLTLRLPQLSSKDGDDVCPYQVDKLCTTHTIRPLGCRVFFCQRGTEDWQQDLYESFLDRLRVLHDDHGIAYRYLDWMAGLREASSTV